MPHFLNGYPAYVNQYEGLLPEGEHGFGGRPQDGARQPGLHGQQPARARQAPLPAADRGAAGVLPLAAADRPALLDPRVLLHDAGDALPAAHSARLSSTPPTGPAFLFSPWSRTCAWLRRLRGGRASAWARRSRRAWLVAMAAATHRDLVPARDRAAAQHRLGRLLAVSRRRHRRRPRAPRRPLRAHQADPPGRQRRGVRDARRPGLQPQERLLPPHRPTTTPTTSWPASPRGGEDRGQPDRRAPVRPLRDAWHEKGEFVLFRRGASSRHGRSRSCAS